jgi:hypothetical protein
MVRLQYLEISASSIGNACCKSTLVYNLSQRHGHQTHTHIGAEARAVVVKEGYYSWPFSFQIPKNIPPSCDYRNGKVMRYHRTVQPLINNNNNR